jgi:hypothetical protein
LNIFFYSEKVKSAYIFMSEDKKKDLFRAEDHRDRVDTVPCVFRREALAFKDMPQMTAAVGAHNLDPAAVGIQVALDCPFNLIIKAWPAAVGIKFIVRPVQGCITLPAVVGAGGFVVCVFSCVGAFGAFMEDDAFFFWG